MTLAGEYHFTQTELTIQENDIENVFAGKNNKSLGETLEHERYIKLSETITEMYAESLDRNLGDFLGDLKAEGDENYELFLNKYGDGRYCRFVLADEGAGQLKGLYVYSVRGELMYIGRCRDSFKKRINQGYGNISPKNCYLDGQATNCHLNALINENIGNIEFFFCPMESDDMIEDAERRLIDQYKPAWNIALT